MISNLTARRSLLEPTIFALILVTYITISLATISMFPVYVDEPGYIDPAASLLFGQGFTSGAWYAQNHSQFWAGNVPLQQFLLYPWMKLFGFSPFSIRSINILYMAAAWTILWISLRNSKIIASANYRLGLIGFLICAYPTSLMHTLGRPDALCYLLATVAFWAGCQRSKIGIPVLYLAGMLSTFAGLQLAAAFGFVCIICLILRRFMVVFALSIGVASGLFFLFCFYDYFGVWHDFVQSVRYHTALNNASQSSRLKLHFGHKIGGYKDYTLLIISFVNIGIFYYWLTLRKTSLRQYLKSEPLPFLAVVCVTLLPIFIGIIGVFPVYYAWIAILPGSIFLFGAISSCLQLEGAKKYFLFAILTIAALIGYPRVLFNAIRFSEDNILEKTALFTSKYTGVGDNILVSKDAWFGAKPIAKRTFFDFWYMDIITPQERYDINLLIMEPDAFERISPGLGGKWVKISETLTLPNRNLYRLPWSDYYEKNPISELAAYRRIR